MNTTKTDERDGILGPFQGQGTEKLSLELAKEKRGREGKGRRLMSL